MLINTAVLITYAKGEIGGRCTLKTSRVIEGASLLAMLINTAVLVTNTKGEIGGRCTLKTRRVLEGASLYSLSTLSIR